VDFIKNKIKSHLLKNTIYKRLDNMFGLGFMEIFVILVIAVIALGPEKLPGVAVDVAKFLKKLKGGD
jgi:hypothetical protein